MKKIIITDQLKVVLIGRLSILELGNLVLASLVVQTGKFVLGSSNYRGRTEDGRT